MNFFISILLLLSCSYIVSVLAANDEQGTLLQSRNLPLLSEMMLLPKDTHVLFLGNYETLPRDIQKGIKQLFSYCSSLGVRDEDFRTTIEVPVITAVAKWAANEGSTSENEVDVKSKLRMAQRDCEKYVWNPETSSKAITPNSMLPIGDLSIVCKQSAFISLPEEELKMEGKTKLEQIHSAIKANLPIAACARIAILEIMLRYKRMNAVSDEIINQYHKHLISNIFNYRSVKKNTQNMTAFIDSIEKLFKNITKLYNYEYVKMVALKGTTKEAGKAIAVSNLSPIEDFQQYNIPRQAYANFERTWNILSRAFEFPVYTHPVILGNLEVIPDNALEIIRKIYKICVTKKLDAQRYGDTQFHLASVITRWKRDHNVKYIEASVKLVAVGIQTLLVHQSTMHHGDDYSTIDSVNKCIREKVRPIDRQSLENKSFGNLFQGVVSSLPPESCVRMTILRYCIKRGYTNADKKLATEKIIDAVKKFAEDNNESQLNSALIQILHEVVSFFEEKHLADEVNRRNNPGWRGPTWRQDSPSSADSSMAESSQTSTERGPEQFSGDIFSSPESAKSYSFEYMLDHAVKSPRSEADRNEVISASPRYYQLSPYFILPDYTYSSILVFTTLMNYDVRYEVSQLLDCVNFDKIDEDVKYSILNKLAEAIFAYKNGAAVDTVRYEMNREWLRCTKFWSYRRVHQRATKWMLDSTLFERRDEIGGSSSIPVSSSSAPMQL